MKTRKNHLMNYYGMNEYQADEALHLWEPVKRALKKNEIYARVNRVSRSGMYRTISLYIVHKGRIKCLNYAFGKIFGDRFSFKTYEVGISGCGMDMLFEANYRLFRALCPKSHYQSYCRYRELS
ncbi:MAG: hypothetical protein PVG39_00920 [Desulfobacteraceae bacterium]